MKMNNNLVEVTCDCTPEKKSKCIMFPEYCEGERKEIIDLYELVNNGLYESLLKQKEERIKELENEITKLKNNEDDLK